MPRYYGGGHEMGAVAGDAGRREWLAQLAARAFDVLVVGGGITGAGVALDAAARGLSVALVDRADFAEGTSSRSTKLVHGGLRYLPMLDVGLVREDLAERGRLLRNAPHLVRPLPFVLPLYEGARQPLGLHLPALLRAAVPLGIQSGLWAYDVLAGSGAARGLPRHRRVSPASAAALVPPMRVDGMRQAYVYYDAATDDARLTISVLRTAVGRGAVATNYAEGEGFVMDGVRGGGASALDRMSGDRLTIAARTTVNATGVWAESVAAMIGPPRFRVRRAKGVHLVVPVDRLPIGRTAFVLPETDDGRLAFVVPWQGVVLVGTTDTEWDGPPDAPPATAADVAYLLDHASRFLRMPLRLDDLLGVYAGLRPLVSTVGAGGAASAHLSRRHEVVSGADGFVTIVGGKLTSYRQMAEDTMNRVLGRPAGTPSPTRDLRLDGAEGLAGAYARLRPRAGRLGLSRRSLVHLLRSYGTGAEAILDLVAGRPALGDLLAPGHPHLAAEVIVSVRDEMAATVADVLLRRTRLGHLLPDHGVGAATRVAAAMADELGWAPEARADQVLAYASAVADLAVPGETARALY